MSNITIKKAKLKDNLFLEVEFDEHLVNNITNKIKRESTAPVHEDMIKAFRLLDPHIALICEEISVEDFERATSEKPEGIVVSLVTSGGKSRKLKTNLFNEIEAEPLPEEAFTVTGFSMGGNGDSEGCTLIGRKALLSGKIMNLISPFTKWDDDYRYTSELAEAIEIVKHEILEFIVNGKQAPDRQQEFGFPEDDLMQGDQVINGVTGPEGDY